MGHNSSTRRSATFSMTMQLPNEPPQVRAMSLSCKGGLRRNNGVADLQAYLNSYQQNQVLHH